MTSPGASGTGSFSIGTTKFNGTTAAGFAIGQVLSGTGVTSGTMITGGTTGAFTINISQTVGPVTVTGS